MMSTKNTTILISGASIAGPTLAYWLKRYGFTPTVIERAPHLREGGYPIDVRYEAVPIAQRMGIWLRLQQEKTSFGEISFVNERNERIGSVNGQAVRQTFDLDVVEIMRGGSRRFDLVVGADGLHSIVRTLVFGDEAQFEHYFGYHFGVFTTDNYLGLDEACAQLYGVPGKQVVLRSTRGN